jgi:hypothetical protein
MNLEWDRDVATWVSSEFENSPVGALSFLRDCMYVKHSMKPLKTNGTWIRNKALSLWQHRNGVIDVSASELKCLAKLEGKTVDHAILREARLRRAETIKKTRMGEILTRN